MPPSHPSQAPRPVPSACMSPRQRGHGASGLVLGPKMIPSTALGASSSPPQNVLSSLTCTRLLSSRESSLITYSEFLPPHPHQSSASASFSLSYCGRPGHDPMGVSCDIGPTQNPAPSAGGTSRVLALLSEVQSCCFPKLRDCPSIPFPPPSPGPLHPSLASGLGTGQIRYPQAVCAV